MIPLDGGWTRNDCYEGSVTSEAPDSEEKINVDDAYSLETPDDNRRLYAKWASTYDEEFIAPNGYVYHENVAAAFCDAGGSAGGAVLDVGCGTGIVGAALGDIGEKQVDGIDISPEMLDVARTKRTVFGDLAYRSLFVADLTEKLDIPDDSYNGIISVGTFTHGHLSAEPIRELVRIAAPSAVCAIGINAQHYVEMGFDALFSELSHAGVITSPANIDVSIYEAMRGEHAGDRANVAIFQVLA
jgi:SAM-dependent methyltransferase